jgi:hypothetical protein
MPLNILRFLFEKKHQQSAGRITGLKTDSPLPIVLVVMQYGQCLCLSKEGRILGHRKNKIGKYA